MVITGLLIAEVTIDAVRLDPQHEGQGILALTQQLLGPIGARVSGAVYVFLHYVSTDNIFLNVYRRATHTSFQALLVAYTAQGGEVAAKALRLGPGVGPALFTLTLGSLLAFAPSNVVEWVNNTFVCLVVLFFVLIISTIAPSVDTHLLLRSQWGDVMNAVPVMFVALVYHNVVPYICSNLGYDQSRVRKVRFALLFGKYLLTQHRQ
jgi:tyrosine-specific transport protein